MISEIRAAAAAAMDRGCAVLPVQGKIPATPRGVHDASREFRLCEVWWNEHHPHRGLALATGEPSGVWVLDLDGPKGLASLVHLQHEHDVLPRTITSRTSRGYHLFFAMPGSGDVRNSAGRVAEGIDVRGTGGYVVLPPSPHPSGRYYSWVEERSPEDLTPARAPDWLIKKMRPEVTAFRTEAEWKAPLPMNGADRRRYVRVAIEHECEELALTPKGQRNEQLNRAAFSLARFVSAGEAHAKPIIEALGIAAEHAGLPRSEIARTLDSAFRARGVA